MLQDFVTRFEEVLTDLEDTPWMLTSIFQPAANRTLRNAEALYNRIKCFTDAEAGVYPLTTSAMPDNLTAALGLAYKTEPAVFLELRNLTRNEPHMLAVIALVQQQQDSSMTLVSAPASFFKSKSYFD
jgi:hypothetical protein